MKIHKVILGKEDMATTAYREWLEHVKECETCRGNVDKAIGYPPDNGREMAFWVLGFTAACDLIVQGKIQIHLEGSHLDVGRN